jgi:site-specific DNA-methyltransferase (adenine-specific)
VIAISQANALALPLADESVDVILTSPPYNVGLKYDGYDDNLSENEFIEFNKQWLTESFRVCSRIARVYVVISDSMLWWFRDVAIETGFAFVQKLVWCKPNFVGSAGKVTNDWNYMTEDILLFRKGKRTPMQNGNTTTHNWFVETVPQSNFTEGRIHPAQFPVSLCLRILDRTPGDLIMDPFCGSGSVLVAAKKLGRAAIGFDLIGDVTHRAYKRVTNTMYPLLTIPVTQGEMTL